MWTKVSTALWTGAAMNVGLFSWSWGQMVFFLERACLQYFSATPHSCCWGCVLDEWEYVLSLYSFPGHLPSEESGLCLGHSMERILGLLCPGWGGGVPCSRSGGCWKDPALSTGAHLQKEGCHSNKASHIMLQNLISNNFAWGKKDAIKRPNRYPKELVWFGTECREVQT